MDTESNNLHNTFICRPPPALPSVPYSYSSIPPSYKADDRSWFQEHNRTSIRIYFQNMPSANRVQDMGPSDSSLETSKDVLCCMRPGTWSDAELLNPDRFERQYGRHETDLKILAGTPHQEKSDPPKLSSPLDSRLASTKNESSNQDSSFREETPAICSTVCFPHDRGGKVKNAILHNINLEKKSMLSPEELKMLNENPNGIVLKYIKNSVLMQEVQNWDTKTNNKASLPLTGLNKGHNCTDERSWMDNKMQEEVLSSLMKTHDLQNIMLISFILYKGQMQDDARDFVSFCNDTEQLLLETLPGLLKNDAEMEERIKILSELLIGAGPAGSNENVEESNRKDHGKETWSSSSCGLLRELLESHSRKAYKAAGEFAPCELSDSTQLCLSLFHTAAVDQIFPVGLQDKKEMEDKQLSTLDAEYMASSLKKSSLMVSFHPSVGSPEVTPEPNLYLSGEEKHLSELASSIESFRQPVENSYYSSNSFRTTPGSQTLPDIIVNNAGMKDSLRSLLRSCIALLLENKNKSTAGENFNKKTFEENKKFQHCEEKPTDTETPKLVEDFELHDLHEITEEVYKKSVPNGIADQMCFSKECIPQKNIDPVRVEEDCESDKSDYDNYEKADFETSEKSLKSLRIESIGTSTVVYEIKPENINKDLESAFKYSSYEARTNSAGHSIVEYLQDQIEQTNQPFDLEIATQCSLEVHNEKTPSRELLKNGSFVLAQSEAAEISSLADSPCSINCASHNIQARLQPFSANLQPIVKPPKVNVQLKAKPRKRIAAKAKRDYINQKLNLMDAFRGRNLGALTLLDKLEYKEKVTGAISAVNRKVYGIGYWKREDSQKPLDDSRVQNPENDSSVDAQWLATPGHKAKLLLTEMLPHVLEPPRPIDINIGEYKLRKTSGTGSGESNKGSPSSTGGCSSNGGGGWGGARPKTLGISRNGGSGGCGGDDPDDNRQWPGKTPPDSLPSGSNSGDVQKIGAQSAKPERNYKHYRKKGHGILNFEQLYYCLGKAGNGIAALQFSEEKEEWLEILDQCIRLCLHETETIILPSSDDLACTNCAVFHALLRHFCSFGHGSDCSLCCRLMVFIQFHVERCLSQHIGAADGEEESQSSVCLRMRQAGLFAQSQGAGILPGKIWLKARKYLNAAFGYVLLLNILETDEVKKCNAASDMPERLDDAAVPNSVSFTADLTNTNSNSPVAQQNLPVILHKDPVAADANISAVSQQTEIAATDKIISGDASILQNEAGLQRKTSGLAGMSDAAEQLKSAAQAVLPKTAVKRRSSVKVTPPMTIPEEPAADEIFAAAKCDPLVSTAAEQLEEKDETMDMIRKYLQEQDFTSPRKHAYDPYATQTTSGYGYPRTVSMPEPRVVNIQGNQMLSVETRPTGVKGIGEVVYGTIQQLKVAANQWSRERDRCKQTGVCEYQFREEGVILHQFKKQLVILLTRYQKHEQWDRLVHLGNGVQGKCHLCIDRSSNFKFCCKRVHILRYDEHELEIWSELQHKNIVHFFGALRHGDKIYLFAEFIDGGSLTAMINEQKLLNRRLSHWTVLNYFRQILQALLYLQSKGILHEDIKADNLLLRQGTTEIVLTDFGAAQKILHGHAPPNRAPTGSPAHWAPEKASSEGHGFPSDLWAAACVLIHMLSGSPPWTGRFPSAAVLNFLIWSKPPPMEDVPGDVKECVRDLIQCCLVKDQHLRPTAQQILGHRAFQMLDQSGSLFSTFYQAAAEGGTTANSAEQGIRSQNLALEGWGAYPEVSRSVTGSTSAASPSTPTRAARQENSIYLPQNQMHGLSGGSFSGPHSLPANLHNRDRNHEKLCRKNSDPQRGRLYSPRESSQQPASEYSAAIVQKSGEVTSCALSPSSLHCEMPDERIALAAMDPQEENVMLQEKNAPSQSSDLAAELQPTPWPDIPHVVLTQAETAVSQSEAITERAGIYTTAVGSASQPTGGGTVLAWRSSTIPVAEPMFPGLSDLSAAAAPYTCTLGHNFSSYDRLCSYGTSNHSASSSSLQQHGSIANPSSCSTNAFLHSELLAGPAANASSSALASWEYSPLSEEDIKVSGSAGWLSIIKEVADLESMSAVNQSETSDDDSSDEALNNYIDDQLTAEHHIVQQDLHSLSQPEPLQAYISPPQEVSKNPNAFSCAGLPNFNLLSIYSDVSTLKSGTIKILHSTGGCTQDSDPAMAKNHSEASRTVSQYTNAFDRPDAQSACSEGQQDATDNLASKWVACGFTDKTVKPQTPKNSDDDHISSGDIFGSGPTASHKDFLEASQYREKQVGSAQDSAAKVSDSLLPLAGTATPGTASSPGLNRKHPNLRLNVNSSTPAVTPISKRPALVSSSGSQSATSNMTGHSRSSAQEEGFFLDPGVSPLTNSPFTPSMTKLTEGSRSRNESGSSLSTPKSSTFDKQEDEWAALRRESPILPTEDHLSFLDPDEVDPILRYHSFTTEYSSELGQEESLMLSNLQGEIDAINLGRELAFTDQDGRFLFCMRVRGNNKWWKELAQTFRVKVASAGYRHFSLYHQNGTTPVEFFSTCDACISTVKVIPLSPDRKDLPSLCWCEDHLFQ